MFCLHRQCVLESRAGDVVLYNIGSDDADL